LSSLQALRNAAAAFAATQWVLNLDADFVPTVETRAALLAAIKSHGYAADGRLLKRAFVVPPFSAQHAFTLPVNFSFVSANLGDDASHAINSWPEVPAHEGDERQFQCHANIDVQRWLMLSHQAASGALAVSAALYKVVQLLSRNDVITRSQVLQGDFVALADSVQLRDGAVLCASLQGPCCGHVSRVALVAALASRAARCRYDERLRRWGGDKQTHAYELASKSYEFFVVPLAAIVHQPHERAKSWSQDKGIKCAGKEICADRIWF
jgi:hypothetical protein